MASRSSDLKLIAAATIAVLLAGGLIAGGIWVATSGTKDVACPELPAGVASDIRRSLQGGTPTFQTGGAGCGFYLDVVDNDIVAYKAIQPSGCTLRFEGDRATCGGDEVDRDALATYPVTIRPVDNLDTVFVDLRPQLPASSTTNTAG